MLKKLREMSPVKLIIATLLLMVVSAGAVYWFFFARPAKAQTDGKPKNTVIVTVGDFTTNLALGDGMRQSIIKVTIDLEVENQKAAAEVSKKLSQIRDVILTEIRDTTLLELNGADGMEHLRQDLMRTVDNQIKPYELLDLYFVDMVVQ